jgi:hypothetical protein
MSRRRFHAAGLNTQTASLVRRRVDLGFQAITILVKDEIHAPVGAAGFFVEAADDLLFFTRSRAIGYLL